MEQEINPWVTKGEELKYENAWIKVVEYDVLNPAGKPGIYGVVHFKNIALGVVPVDDEGYTYLVGQYRYALNAYSWEIPEGGGNPAIEPLEGIKRELLEETGLLAERWQLVSTIHTSNSVCNEVGYIYLAEGLTQGQSEPEETEDLRIKKLPLKEAVDMVLNNEITDSLSIAGLLKVAVLKGLL